MGYASLAKRIAGNWRELSFLDGLYSGLVLAKEPFRFRKPRKV